MTARFCSFCGKPLPPTGTFCPNCGAAIPGGASAPGATGGIPGPVPATSGMPGYGPAGYPAGSSGPTPATRNTDIRSLSTVEWAAVVGLLAAVEGLLIAVTGRVTSLIRVTTTPAGSTLSLPSPWVWAVFLGFGAVFLLAEIYLWRSAFHGLSGIDSRFSTPSTLALVAFVGSLLVIAGYASVLNGLYLTVQCDGAGHPITRACLPWAQFVGGVAAALIGALVLLVGFIGLLIGIWRLGTRFNDGVFKVSAILLIFPVLNLVGAILILVTARSKRHLLSATMGAPIPPGAG